MKFLIFLLLIPNLLCLSEADYLLRQIKRLERSMAYEKSVETKMLHSHFQEKWQHWNRKREAILNPWYLARMSFVHSKNGELNHTADCPKSAEIEPKNRINNLHPTKDFHKDCVLYPLTPLMVDENGLVIYTLQDIPNRRKLIETLHFYGFSDRPRYVRDKGARARRVLDQLQEYKPELGVLVD